MNALVNPKSIAGVVRALMDFADNDRFDHSILAAATGIGEGLNVDGGFLVGGSLAAEVWSKVYLTGQIISRCTDQPVTKKTGITVPGISETSRADGARFGGVRSYFVGEGEAPSLSKPAFSSANLSLRKLLTIIYATDELKDDVPALAAFLERVMALEMQFTIEDRIINANGSGTFLGVLATPALIAVPIESGQGSQTVLFSNLANMSARLWGPSHQNAVWLMSNDVYQQLLLLTTPAGGPVIVDGPDGSQRIMGKPILLTEYTPALGNVGDIMLCDFSQYLLALAKSPIEESIHVKFDTDETAFKLRYRTDGAPGWQSAITPKNSTNTQSPFIALAARP